MIGLLILFLIPGIVAFGLALFLRRGCKLMAWIVGSLPAAWLAAENTATLANPMTWFLILMFWLPSVAGAIIGAEFARWLRGRRSVRPSG